MIPKPIIPVVAALVLAAPVTALAADSPSSGSVDRAVAVHRDQGSRHEMSTRDRVRAMDRHDRSSQDAMSRDHSVSGRDL
jgi:hypothetical protein